MSSQREAGWWLPPPRDKFDADNGPERNTRFRFVGAMVVKLWLMLVVGFGGLMWSDPHLTSGQQFFGTIVFAASTGFLLLGFMSLCWFSS